MPVPTAPRVVLTDDERETLARWERRHNSAQALALRCRIVLACAQGGSNSEIAGRLGVNRSTVAKWRSRFVEHRLDGLHDASGNVIADLAPRHRSEEFRRFLNLIDKHVPEGLDVHLVLDNQSTRRTPSIQRWLVRHPRFHLHFTPAYSSWLNLVERWFAELTNRWLRRGTHHSVRDLTASIRTWIANWNDDPKPFIWHKTADEILASLANYCQRISDSRH